MYNKQKQPENRDIKSLLDYYCSPDFRATKSNADVVSKLCEELFIRILQSEVEKEQKEINQIRKLNNRREKRTIPDILYLKVSQRIFKDYLDFLSGEIGQYNSETISSRGV